VRAAAVALGGIVSSESSGFLPATDVSGDGRAESSEAVPVVGQSVITVRVPEPKLDDALARLGAVGREVDRSTSTEDVTATIADLDSRVTTQARSVARVRDLLAKAKSLSDIVLLESEVARREADLESIQARQRALADQADLATVTVTLRTPQASTATSSDGSQGFLGGLHQGWHAVERSTTLVLTVLGAALPVGVALALIGWPSFLLYRRVAHSRRAAQSRRAGLSLRADESTPATEPSVAPPPQPSVAPPPQP
jgi:hypothetical protein